MKIRRQELELLAEWLGFEYVTMSNDKSAVYRIEHGKLREWNPSPEGNDTDFLNMVAGKEVSFIWCDPLHKVTATCGHRCNSQYYVDQPKLAAMKHAAYQVCLMAAMEWKESK